MYKVPFFFHRSYVHIAVIPTAFIGIKLAHTCVRIINVDVRTSGDTMHCSTFQETSVSQ